MSPKQSKKIPEDQWELPVGFSDGDTFVTLKEYGANPVEKHSLTSHSVEDWKRLVIARIELQKSYPTRYMLGFGEVDKQSALNEIKSDSSAGEFIIESEMKVIEIMKARISESGLTNSH